MRRMLFFLVIFSFLAAGLGAGQPVLASQAEQGQAAPEQTPAGAGSGFTAIDAGDEHTCGLTAAGGAKCWGENWARLGNDSVEGSNLPVDVVGLTAGVAAISAGSFHSCAVTAAGAAMCWGDNYWGQLGNGSTFWSKVPVSVSGLSSGVSDITTGESHTCALTAAGGVRCWGDNSYGQLGNGSNTASLTPVNVSGLNSGVVAVEASNYYTCALTAAGGVKCWGLALGAVLAPDNLVPVDIPGLTSGVSAISAGLYHACAVKSGGALCWGSNVTGQLGDGTGMDSPTPVNVSGLGSGVAAIAAGQGFSCAVTGAGEMRCWGDNRRGQLGDGTAASSLTPVVVSGPAGAAIRVTAGTNHACATTTGGALCWGDNREGQLGNGGLPYSLTPVDFTGWSGGVLAITGGQDFSCAATMSGEARCWGENIYGQLGNGTSVNSIAPVGVSGLTGGVSALAAGVHTCAIVSGQVFCWEGVPAQVDGLGSGVKAVAAGESHKCALTGANGVRCWGGNAQGQLGDGTLYSSLIPVDVIGLTSGASAVTTGNYHSCAVAAGGGVQCWGWNVSGQLGNGTTADSNTPVNVSGLSSGVVAITAGYTHTCALTSSGGVKCWGSGWQLGDGKATNSSIPVAVSGLQSGVSAIAAKGYHTCALLTSGGVKCWGHNEYGELGNGTQNGSTTPVSVTGLSSGATGIAAGFFHSCALTASGAKCWGKNEYGELGNGLAGYSPTPVKVFAPLPFYLPMVIR